jgi:hypothetical protein
VTSTSGQGGGDRQPAGEALGSLLRHAIEQAVAADAVGEKGFGALALQLALPVGMVVSTRTAESLDGGP